MHVKTTTSHLIAMLICLSMTATHSHAADRTCRPLPKGESVRVDFKATPLRDVVRFISCAAELNMVLEPASLGGQTITVIAPRPVKASDLMPLLSASLRHLGLFAEQRGAYMVIRRDPTQVPSKRRSSSGR